MELVRVIIKNYRSIEEVEINVTDKCLIFLGINESGKSNILRGISSLSSDFSFNFQEDARIPTNDEYVFKDPNIVYTFKLSDTEKKQILEYVFGSDRKDWPIYFPTKSYNAFIQGFLNEIMYGLTFSRDNSKNVNLKINIESRDFEAKPNLVFVTEDVEIPMEGMEPVKYPKGKILRTDEAFVHVMDSQFTTLSRSFDAQDFINLLLPHVQEYVTSNLPSIIYWKYDQKYLLTESVQIDEFKKNPDISLPLRNIFRLAGIPDIEHCIDSHYPHDSAFIIYWRNSLRLQQIT